MKKILVLSVLSFASLNTLAQLPTIRAEGGGGKNVNWPLIKKQSDPEGPGYFYGDCDQEVKGIRASSVLAGQGKKTYGPKNVSDADPMSAWVEGKPDYGIGEYFEVKAATINKIYNGYQSSPKNWAENSRVKRFKVYKNNKPLCFLDLTDEMGGQHFELPGHNMTRTDIESIFKFEIVDVYKGSKWPDVAISEIGWAACCFIGSTNIESDHQSSRIADLENGDAIYSVDLKSGTISSTQVEKVTKQTHLSVLKVETTNRAIEITFDHPLYIKDFGFSSLARYMHTKKIENFQELVGKIELMVLDETSHQMKFEPLKSLELHQGVFETFSILKIKAGENFIANGFVTKVY
jgi:hypothetical protein